MQCTGRRHQTTPDLPSSKKMTDLLASVLTDVSSSLTTPVCYTLEEWDVRSEIVRTDEVRIPIPAADILLSESFDCHNYDSEFSNGLS